MSERGHDDEARLVGDYCTIAHSHPHRGRTQCVWNVLHAKSFDNGFPVSTQYDFSRTYWIVHPEHQIEGVQASKVNEKTILPSRSTRPSKVQISFRSDEFSKKYTCMSIPFCLEMIYIFWCFSLKVAAALPIVRFGVIGNPIFFTALSMSFSTLTTAPEIGTPAFLKSFFISDWTSGFQIFWLSPEYYWMFPKPHPIPNQLIVGFDIDWTISKRETATASLLHFIQIFQIFNTEIFC